MSTYQQRIGHVIDPHEATEVIRSFDDRPSTAKLRDDIARFLNGEAGVFSAALAILPTILVVLGSEINKRLTLPRRTTELWIREEVAEMINAKDAFSAGEEMADLIGLIGLHLFERAVEKGDDRNSEHVVDRLREWAIVDMADGFVDKLRYNRFLRSIEEAGSSEAVKAAEDYESPEPYEPF